MFGFNLCKVLRRAVVVSNPPPILQLHFAHNRSILYVSSVRYKSSSVNSTNERSITVSYLINSCGLSLESALIASKHLHFKTLTQPNSVLSLLNNLGFSQTQITKLIRKYPKVLACNPEKTLLPKLDFLQLKGFSSSDIISILLSCPQLLGRSLENHIIPTFDFLNGFLQSEEKTVAAIKRCHTILHQSIKGMALKIDLLRDKGVSESNIVALLHYSSGIFTTSLDKLKMTVEEAMDMGFDPSKGTFRAAVVSLTAMTKSTWEKKVDVYKMWNLSEPEILAAFRIQPQFMATSKDKIIAVMNLFVNNLGWESSIIAKRPFLMSCSLEKRLLPRASVLQFLVAKGLVQKNCRSTAIFWCSEAIFLKKFVNCYDEAPEILKLYEEKFSLSVKKTRNSLRGFETAL